MDQVQGQQQIDTVLIANRGEIAVRIIRAVQAQGWTAISVYSDADRGALHTQLADRAIGIGGAAAADSYLDMTKVLAAASTGGAQAIHPGYGFLSENAEFAEACAKAGHIFIGPTPETIRLMGDKRAAKRSVAQVDVPCIPGYDDADQSDERLIAAAQEIGAPLMVKAAAGGGGRGMRLVQNLTELPSAISSARLEAQNAFGSGDLLLERALFDSRHIEVQVVGDRFGNLIHLGERDCSLQRKHQKVIEEAPSPFVDDALRQQLGEAAIRAARSCDYVGVGTVEFLVAEDRSFAFLEMNTRLQVEHPVTELVTGADLVAAQLQIANGQPLTIEQSDVTLRGHAIEVRLYAEDPAAGFVPQTGDILRWHPASGDDVRVDHGLHPQDRISPHYDPMIAKLIVHAASREAAIARSRRAVQQTQILGLKTNQQFLGQLLLDSTFAAGEATTDYIDHDLVMSDLLNTPTPSAAIGLAVVGLINAQDPQPDELRYWSNTAALPRRRRLLIDGREFLADVTATPTEVAIALVDVAGDERTEHTVVNCAVREAELSANVDGVDLNYPVCFEMRGTQQCPTLFLQSEQGQIELVDTTYQPPVAQNAATDGLINASTEGKVVAVAVEMGQTVATGDLLVVVEAMKLEHRHTAPAAGVVVELAADLGAQVKKDDRLWALTLSEATEAKEAAEG